MDKVIVTWLDAWGEDKQVEKVDIDHSPIVTDTIGFLIKENEVGVTIAMDSYPSHPTEVRNYAFIPRGMIRKITYLTLLLPDSE
jgi:hypothetical protein